MKRVRGWGRCQKRGRLDHNTSIRPSSLFQVIRPIGDTGHRWCEKNEKTEIALAKKNPSTLVAPKRMSTRRIWSTLSINGSGKVGRIQWETPRQDLRQQRTCSGNRGSRLERRTQVWSLSQFYSVGLLQSWIAVKLCACANSQSRFWVTSA